MTRKADFNADEWTTLVEAPLLAGMRVVTSSRGGTIRESMALGQAYREARERHGESELLDELVSSPPALGQQQGLGSREDLPRVVTERLRGAVELLEQKATPDEAEAYKRFVLSGARAVAGAHKEGGFLGIGGKAISDEEQAALDEIAQTLGVSSDAG